MMHWVLIIYIDGVPAKKPVATATTTEESHSRRPARQPSASTAAATGTPPRPVAPAVAVAPVPVPVAVAAPAPRQPSHVVVPRKEVNVFLIISYHTNVRYSYVDMI